MVQSHSGYRGGEEISLDVNTRGGTGSRKQLRLSPECKGVVLYLLQVHPVLACSSVTNWLNQGFMVLGTKMGISLHRNGIELMYFFFFVSYSSNDWNTLKRSCG